MPSDRKASSVRRGTTATGEKLCRKSNDKATLFMTEVSNIRKDSVLSNDSTDLDLEKELTDAEEPRRKLGVDDIKLELYRRECRNLDITPVGAYLRSPSSPILAIKHYSLGPRGAKALSVPLLIDSSVTTLNLEGNDIGPEGMGYLMEPLLETCTITHLDLGHNGLGSAGAAIVCQVMMSNSCLRSIVLSGNHFKDPDAVHFAQVLMERKTLKDLDLSNNELGDAGVSKIGSALSVNDTLESLDLSWNHIRPKGGMAVFAGIKENVGLKRLNVSHNGLGDEGCAAAGAALAVNSSLLELDLSSNRATNKGIMALAAQLTSNETLQVLKLGENLVTGLGAQAIVEAIFKSENCAINILDLTNINIWESVNKLVQENAQSRPLNLVHDKVTRNEVPLKELEQQIKDKIMATAAAAAEAAAAAALLQDGAENEQQMNNVKVDETRDDKAKKKGKKTQDTPGEGQTVENNGKEQAESMEKSNEEKERQNESDNGLDIVVKESAGINGKELGEDNGDILTDEDKPQESRSEHETPERNSDSQHDGSVSVSGLESDRPLDVDDGDTTLENDNGGSSVNKDVLETVPGDAAQSEDGEENESLEAFEES